MNSAIFFRNYLPVIPPAGFVTAALLILMYSLIATDYIEPIEEPRKIDTSFLEPVQDPAPPKIKAPPKPEKVQKSPERIRPILNIDEGNTATAGLTMKLTPIANDMLLINPDSGPIPSVRVQPNYPASALQRGIEGFVDIMFDINAAGSTENIRIIRSEPERVFNRAAVKAISKWKYQPQTIDGKAVAAYDQVTRLTFNLED